MMQMKQNMDFKIGTLEKCPWQWGTREHWSVHAPSWLFSAWELRVSYCGKAKRLQWVGLQGCLFWESPGAWGWVGARLAQQAHHEGDFAST